MTNPVEPVAPAPQAPPPLPAVEPPWSKRAIVAAICVATPLIAAAGIAVAARVGYQPVAEAEDASFALFFLVIFVMPLVAGVVGGSAIRSLRALEAETRPRGLGLARAARTGGYSIFFALMAFACFGSTLMRGRQLRRFGRPQLARLTDDAHGWTAANDDASTAHLDPLVRAAPSPASMRAAAAAWRHNALTEHASVAAFSRLALDLMAVGAPARLIEACQHDALDEVQHTTLCFGIARSLDGDGAAGPGPLPAVRSMALRLPWRRARLAQLAVEGLVEGALLEGAAAALAVELARRTMHASARAALAHIAADEARHAAHGCDVVRWCIAEGGAPVIAALQAAARHVPRVVDDEGPAPDGSLESLGIAGRALQDEVYARVREDVVARSQSLSTTRAHVRRNA